MPPRWMWALEDDLKIHFQRVVARRENGGIDDDDREDTAPMLQNEYAKNRGRNAR